MGYQIYVVIAVNTRMLTSAALLCFKWANGGVPNGLEKYILGVLIATQCLAGVAYLKKGIPGPSAAYLATSLLMGIAAGKKV